MMRIPLLQSAGFGDPKVPWCYTKETNQSSCENSHPASFKADPELAGGL